MGQTKKRLAAAVKESGTTLTEVFGVGPVVASIAIAEAQDVSRFSDRDHFAAYNGTAPIEVTSGKRKVHRLSRRGNRRLNHAIHMTAITQIRQLHSEGRAYYDKKIAGGKPRKKPCAPSNGASATPSTGTCAPTPPEQQPSSQAREGNRGTTLTPARPAHTPHTSSSAKPLPDPHPPYAPAPTTQPGNPAHAHRKRSPEPLDTKRLRYVRVGPCSGHQHAAAPNRLICSPTALGSCR
jgi:transposase